MRRAGSPGSCVNTAPVPSPPQPPPGPSAPQPGRPAHSSAGWMSAASSTAPGHLEGRGQVLVPGLRTDASLFPGPSPPPPFPHQVYLETPRPSGFWKHSSFLVFIQLRCVNTARLQEGRQMQTERLDRVLLTVGVQRRPWGHIPARLLPAVDLRPGLRPAGHSQPLTGGSVYTNVPFTRMCHAHVHVSWQGAVSLKTET